MYPLLRCVDGVVVVGGAGVRVGQYALLSLLRLSVQLVVAVVAVAVVVAAVADARVDAVVPWRPAIVRERAIVRESAAAPARDRRVLEIWPRAVVPARETNRRNDAASTAAFPVDCEVPVGVDVDDAVGGGGVICSRWRCWSVVVVLQRTSRGGQCHCCFRCCRCWECDGCCCCCCAS